MKKMINRVENINLGAIVSEKFLHHFYRKGFSVESISKQSLRSGVSQLAGVEILLSQIHVPSAASCIGRHSVLQTREAASLIKGSFATVGEAIIRPTLFLFARSGSQILSVPRLE